MVHDRRTDGKSDIYRWVPLLKKSIFRTVCNSLWDEKKKKNCEASSLIQTLIYSLNIYYSKIYYYYSKRED